MSLSAAEILAAGSPADVLPRDADKARDVYRQLMSVWHPDKGGRTDVAAKLNKLYVEHGELLRDGRWEHQQVLSVLTAAGKWVDVDYFTKNQFELGTVYVGKDHVTYEMSASYDDLLDNAVSTIKGLRYADAKMEAEIKRYLPTIKDRFSTPGYCYLMLHRHPDQLLLRDVLAHLKKLEPVHVAWIISACYNLGCYLHWSKLVHNAPTLESLFITPQQHTVSLLGGWWYSVKMTEQVKALPAISAVKSKTPTHQIFLELVKRSARELLGDQAGSKLLGDLTIPNALLRYLQVAANADPLKTYSDWPSILTAAFGARKFHDLKLRSTDIYK